MTEQEKVDVARPDAGFGVVGRRPGPVVALCLAVAAASAVGVGVLWLVFVDTVRGQQVEATAMRGARFGQTHLWHVADDVLSVVSVGFIASVLVAAVLIAVLRRRWALAVQVAVLLVGANVTTQVLKYRVLDRPDLGVHPASHNTLPSGHTTAAASVSAALLLVVPPRARPWVAAVGAAYTTATGVSTLVGQWHRPADVVAATLVVLAWTALACALVAGWHGPPEFGAGSADATRSTDRATYRGMLAVLVVLGVGAAAVATVALAHTWRAAGAAGRAALLTAYAGGAAGAVAGACLTFAAMLALRAAASRGSSTGLPSRLPRA